MSARSPKLLAVDNLRRHFALLEQAASQLQAGGLVAFPTETSYRLAARPDDEAALRRLYEAGRRASGRPLSLHFGDLASLEPWVTSISDSARRLLEFFLPGPLVLLLWRSERVHPLISADLRKVAVRVPLHPLAQEWLRLTGPVAGISTRLGCASPLLRAASVLEAFEPQLESVLEWRDPPLALEPTVVDATCDPVRIVSPGFLKSSDLSMVLSRPAILSSDLPTPRRFQRFLPSVQLIVVEGGSERVPRRLRTLIDSYSITEKVALLVTRETAEGAFDPPPRVAHFAVVGSRTDPDSLETGLRETLQRLEQEVRASVILVEGVARDGAGAGFMERLCRDAHQVINTEDPGYSGQAGLRMRER